MNRRIVTSHNSDLAKFNRMIRRRLPLILMLIMALVPVAVAYAHYTDVAGEIAAMRVSMTIDHANPEPYVADHCQTHSLHPDKLHSSGCGFHVCVGCAVTSSFQFNTTHSPSFYSLSEKLEPISLIAPPAIRPPISHL